MYMNFDRGGLIDYGQTRERPKEERWFTWAASYPDAARGKKELSVCTILGGLFVFFVFSTNRSFLAPRLLPFPSCTPTPGHGMAQFALFFLFSFVIFLIPHILYLRPRHKISLEPHGGSWTQTHTHTQTHTDGHRDGWTIY